MALLNPRLASLAALLSIAACTSAEGDVLTSARSDGGAQLADADPTAPDADPFGCPAAPSCPPPMPGDITVCGRVHDLETSEPVRSGAPVVRVFDLVELRTEPLDAVELARVEPDDCGYFSAQVDGSTGVFVIATGALPTEPDDGYQRVTHLITTAPGQVARATAWVLRDTTEDAWNTGADLTIGFADIGSLMAIFVDVTKPPVGPLQGTPVSGVSMTANGGNNVPGDYYFTDGAPLARALVSPDGTATGANGAGLVRAPVQISTYGGSHPSCTFGAAQGLTIPSAVQVQEIAGTCP